MDYLSTRTARRREWYGAKRVIKRFLAWRIPNRLLRTVVALAPALRSSGRLPVSSSIEEVEGRAPGGQTFVMLSPDRCVIAKELYWGRGLRPQPADNMAVTLFAELARQADVMLDIGAYTGLFSLLSSAVNPRLETHAFEIVPDVYVLLFQNCVRNNVLDRVTCHHSGVGDPGSTWTAPRKARHSALPCFYSTHLQFSDGCSVKLRALDSMAPWFAPASRVLVKIDVEGTENEVLQYGQQFLANFRPRILCEVLVGSADPGALEALLTPHGYRFYLVRETDLLAAETITADVQYRDWLFCHDGPLELEALGMAVKGGE